VVTLRASTTYDPLGESCEDNSSLLDILDADNTSLFCTGATPEDIVNGTTACASHPRAACAPELGFRCSGEVRVARTYEGACAAAFRPDDDNATACIGVMPWRCNTDSDCPARAACDHANGGVCISGCRLDTDCETNETCDCRGKCVGEEDAQTTAVRRPVIRLDPQVLSFSEVDDSVTDADTVAYAQRIFVSVTNPNGVASQTVEIVATAGMLVSCDRWKINSGVPDFSTFGQTCSLTYTVDQTHNQALWVLPYGLQNPTETSGRVFVRHDDGTTTVEASASMSVTETPELVATAPSGWYSGTLTLVGAGIPDPQATSAFESVAAQAPPWPVDSPVTVWRVDNAPDDIRLSVFDESQTVTADGWLGLKYTNLAHPPALNGYPGWFSNSLEQRVDDAAGALEQLAGAVGSVLSFDDNTSLIWDETAETLQATFGVQVRGETSVIAQASTVWRLDLRPDPSRTTPPALAAAPDAVPTSSEPNPWVQRAAAVFSPLHFASDIAWQSSTTSNDIVNCLHSPRAFSDGSTSLLLERLKDSIGPAYGIAEADYGNLISSLLTHNPGVSADVLADRYEFCCEPNYDGYQTYVCRCDEQMEQATSVRVPGSKPCTQADTDGKVTLTACPVENDTISPQVHILGSEELDRYLLAATCAVRVANLGDLTAWSDTASAASALADYYSGLDPELVDPFSGDLLAWQHPRYTETTSTDDYWFHARSSSDEPRYEFPAKASNLPFFGQDPGLGQHEMAAVCLSDLMRPVPDAFLPGGPSTIQGPNDLNDLTPIAIPIAASHDLIVTPAKYGLTIEIVVAGNDRPLEVDYDIATGAIVLRSETGATGDALTTVAEVEDELRQMTGVFSSVFATGVATTKDETILAVPATSLDPLDGMTWSRLRPHAEDLFQNAGCIDVARFHIETDWLASAAEIEAQWDENATIIVEPEMTVASRLLQRRLSQWLTIHAYVARDAAQADKMRTVMELENQPDTSPVPLDDAFDAMERGLSLILYPQYFDILTNMPNEWVADPDYRVASDPADFAAHHEQGLGLPVILLDTVAAYLELGDRYLETVETDIFLESLTSNSREGRKALMARFGRMMRYTLAIEALANGLYAKAKRHAEDTSTALPWAEDWKHAREKSGATLNRLAAHMNRVLDGQNPLGISDDDLPLYFVDPQTTNQRFFASSDYLLQTWAIPAVARADSRLDAARQAQIAKQDSEFRQLLTEQDLVRRTRDLKTHYGTPLRVACGLSNQAENVFDAFLNGEYDLSTCQYVPSNLNGQCESRIEKAWRTTDSTELMDLVTECGSPAAEAAGGKLFGARRALCSLMRARATQKDLTVSRDTKKKNLNPFAYWDEYANFNIEVPDGLIDHLGPVDDIAFDIDYYILETPGGVASLQTGANHLESWPFFDDMQLDGCGDTIVLPSSIGLLTVSTIDQWTSEVATFLGNGESGLCTVKSGGDCKGKSTVQALLDKHGPWCDEYFSSHMFPIEFVSPAQLEEAFFAPEELAECYRGTLAELELDTLAARVQIRASLTALDEIKSRYDSVARTCLQLAQLDDTLTDAMDAHYKAVQSLNKTAGLFGAAVSFVKGVARGDVGGGIIDGIAGAIGTGMDQQRGELDHQFALVQQNIQSQKEALQCWAQAEQTILGYGTQVEAVKAALFNTTQSYVRHKNLIVELAAGLNEGAAIISNEEELFNQLPDQRHSYWYDEKLDRFDSDFAWAKRLTYLAMLAAEYELQQSFDLRELILEAEHPMELEAAIRQIEQQQATRGINGRRPESKTFVRSLRDEVLKLHDSTVLSSEEAGGLRRMPAVNSWLGDLMSTANSVFSSDGEYLGQGLRFNLSPDDALHYRCAERMWSVSAALQGDLLGVIEPQLPVFLLKRNTFASQWCDGRGPDGEQFQTGTLRPSVNLFVDSASTGQSNEAEAYSWGFVDAWINVKRKDFYSEKYTEGASDELAGRGLYGDYMLLIPNKGFIDQGVPLDRIEDVLLKFDYVSVDNGGSLGNPPPGYDEQPFDPGIVHDLQATVDSSPDTVTLTWRPSTAVVATGQYAVYRNGVLLDDDVTAETYTDTSGTLCGVYTVSVVDNYADILPGVSVTPDWSHTWGCHILRADGTLDAIVSGGLNGVDSPTAHFTLVVVLWNQGSAPLLGGRTIGATNGASLILQAFTKPAAGGNGGSHLFGGRIESGALSTLEGALSGDTSGLTVQVFEVDRAARELRGQTIYPDGSKSTEVVVSTGPAGTFLAADDLYWLGANNGYYWGGGAEDPGLIGAAVIDGHVTDAERESLAAGNAPWVAVDAADVLHAYGPGDYYSVGSTVYIKDVAYDHGGSEDPLDAELRHGDASDIELR